MKHLLANRPSAPNNSLESEGKSCDVIELNRARLAQSLINDKPDLGGTKRGKPTQNIGTNKSQRLPQSSSSAPRLPPAGLKQTLEYSVSINSDGTVQRIRPLSNASGEYIDQTNLPLPGSAFVSPKEDGGNTNIYVAFSPDGKVKASLD